MAQQRPGSQPRSSTGAGGWVLLGCGGFLGLFVLAAACSALFADDEVAPASAPQAAARPTTTVVVTVTETVTVTASPSRRPRTPTPTAKPKPKPKPKPSTPKPAAPANDPRFGTCAAANAAGYGPYVQGSDPEYAWYIDRDKDGVVCER
ncbi:excalibur calcium-binding domain-containing protein [Actinocorallia sp. A-T 12471]|uniref:excalibur calcium-binding domain-containing protein n=1 Tax=Actinocorallia sp. A-T 12471 TaxID=3089813 RepID=UPI0029CC0B11|nr:excalibur calcium-binding domain-containing protein [Actinocorallia sp. A-T 12471]MDX6740078.1 excalibur calcium-binding domain-containing protein [Actinocorallia sp. A-T 12471]